MNRRAAIIFFLYIFVSASPQTAWAADSLGEAAVKSVPVQETADRDLDSVVEAAFVEPWHTNPAYDEVLLPPAIPSDASCPTCFTAVCNCCCSPPEPPYRTTYGFPMLAGGARRRMAGCERCGSNVRWGLCDCCLGDPFTLCGARYGLSDPIITIGGWLSAGYHSKSNNLFNDRPDKFALHQGWLYAEKSADPTASRWGFRVDVLYGIDADDAQVFGGPAGTWDYLNGLDHGAYGWAIPQAYGEIAVGQWNVILGHFLTPVGYETVTAPDNFFYSHSMSMYNSQPRTQTGVLVTRPFNGRHMFVGGWTQGWDIGFKQQTNDDSWLAGTIWQLSECVAFSHFWSTGTFCARGTDGNAHTFLLDSALTNRLNWVLQSDLFRMDSTGEDNFGLTQYLFYTVSDWLRFGTRIEWWKGDGITGYAPHGAVLPNAGSWSYYALTGGVNIRPHANFVLRPEVRYDWSPAANYDEAYFGMDAIVTF